MIPLNKGDFYEMHTAYRLALIHSICSLNGQSELTVTHANTPISTTPLQEHHFPTPLHYFLSIAFICLTQRKLKLCNAFISKHIVY